MRLKLNEIKLKLLSAEGKRASLIFLLILIPLLIFGISKVNVKNESIVQIPESQYLYVKDYYLNEPREFVFEFSDPVDQHLLEHHFFISPELKGKLVENGNDKKYKFIADTDIPENSFITITILAGLTSKNRKPFLEDFYMDFDNTAQAENIFTKNDIPGRVMSFASGKPVDLTIEKHKGAKTMTVNVYKSDNASLLNFLSYKTVKEGDDSFSYDQEVFIRNRVNHPKEALFESRVIKESKSSQKFNLEPGIYYIEATDGKNKSFSASYLIVSKNGVALRQDDQKIVLANFDTNTGAKIKEGAEAVLYNLKDAPTRMGTFKYNEQEKGFNVPFTDRIDAALVTIGSETVFVPLKVSYSFADIRATKDLEKYPKIFIYTERPIYKPGDRVFFRGIVRYDSDSLYKVPSAGTPVYINTQNYSEGNKEPTKLTVLTDSKGLFYGDYEISKEKKAGTEYLQASLLPPKENSSSYPFFSANYDVAVYTKPKYEIKVEAVNTEYLKHEKPKFIISGKYFSGEPMKDQTVEYQAYTTDYYEAEKMVYNKNFNINSFGGMCGGGGFDYYGTPLGEARKIKLDSSGKATVEFPDDPKALLSQKITLSAKKTDDSKNEIIGMDNTIRHAGAFNIFFIPSSSNYKPGDLASVPFYSEELNGEKVAGKEFNYRLVEDNYTNNVSTEKVILTGKVNSDDKGMGKISFTVPQSTDDYKYLIIQGEDRFGNKIETRKSIYISQDKTSENAFGRSSYDTFLKITSSQNSFQNGQTINLNVNSPADLDVLMSFERGRIYSPQLVHLNKGDNKITIPVDVEMSPSITPVFSFFYNGAYYTEGLSLNVPAMHKLLNISVSTDKSEYKKGEDAKLTIKVKDSKGNPTSADLSMGVVDKAIYALRESATPAVHSEFYYFRDRTTNASSSLTWVGSFGDGGRGGGGGGGELFNKLVDTLYWNPNIHIDSSGETTLSVPLGATGTIWKAMVIGSDDSTDVGQSDTEFLVK